MSQQVRGSRPGARVREHRPTIEYPRVPEARPESDDRVVRSADCGSRARARRSSGLGSSCTGRPPEKNRTAHYPFSMQALVCKASRCTW
jgi:hypothetical protein